MEQDKDENELNQPVTPDGDALYGDMATEEPERDIEITLPKGNVGGSLGSLSDAESSPNTTDLQITLQYLFPDFKGTILGKVTQAVRSVMFARISPDVFLNMIYLTVTSVVEQMDADGEEDIDVQAIINMVYTAFSIGLEGKGRIEAAQVYGAAKENSELERVAQGLGLNG